MNGRNPVKINLIDVGAAEGLPEPWKSHSALIGKMLRFEPREQAAQDANVISLSDMLWEKEEERNFFIYRGFKGSGSSLFLQNYDYVLNNFETLKTRGPAGLADTWIERSLPVDVQRVQCRSLDSVLRELNPTYPYHFLKIDAQGAEYQILRGAERYLRNDCYGLHLELFEVPLYKGIKLLDEVRAYLEPLGFELVKKYPAHGTFDSQHDCVFLKRDKNDPFMDSIRAAYILPTAVPRQSMQQQRLSPSYATGQATDIQGALRFSRERLGAFQNIHAGRRCVIIGNGPSLNKMDLSFLEHEICFGMNKIFLLFDKWKFRPTYYASVNPLVIEQSADEILKLPCPKFLSRNGFRFFDDPGDMNFINTHTRWEFSLDPRNGLHEGWTVTFFALQLAYYMGFSEVVLIGVDHYFVTPGDPNKEVVSQGDDPNHFHPDYFGKGKNWNLPDLERSEQSYRMAKAAFEAAGRRIIDATFEGKLTVFPKADYRNLFYNTLSSSCGVKSVPPAGNVPTVDSSCDAAPVNREFLDKQREFWNVRTMEEAMFKRVYTDPAINRLPAEEKIALWNKSVNSSINRLLDGIPAKHDWKVLEIGCGVGRLIKPLRQRFAAVDGVDIAENMIDFARQYLADGKQNGQVLLNSGSDLSAFPDACYDFVFSMIVFQHIRSVSVVRSYFREIFRVLKPGGYFKIQVHRAGTCGYGSAQDEADTDRQYGFFGNGYTEENLKDLLRESGLSVACLKPEGQWIWATAVKPSPVEEGQYLVSAIVSTYNSEKFIRGCLEDLEAQTIADRLEIIIVDSCSEQNEQFVVQEFQKKYPNITYVRTEKRENLYASWNRAIRIARGRYITNANADDRHRRDAFAVLSAALEDNEDVDLVYADSYISTEPNETFEENAKTRLFRCPAFFAPAALLDYQFGPQPMWRKSLHERIGFFNEHYRAVGDYDFNIRVAAEAKALHIPEVLGLYLEHQGSITAENGVMRKENRAITARYRTEEVITACYRRAGICPVNADVWARIFIDMGVRALEYFPSWKEGRPKSAFGFAASCFEKALNICPGLAEAKYNLAALQKLQSSGANNMPLVLMRSGLRLPTQKELYEGFVPDFHKETSGQASSAAQSEKKRILIACDFFLPSIGGVELYVKELAVRLSQEDYHVEIATRFLPERKDFYIEGIKINQFKVKGLFKSSNKHDTTGIDGDLESYYSFVHESAFDLVIILAQPDTWVAMLLEQKNRGLPPVVLMPSISSYNLNAWVPRGIMDRIAHILRAADMLIAVTENGHDTRMFHQLGLHFTYIPHAVEKKAGQYTFRDRHGLKKNVPLLLMVGNFRPVKNHIQLLDVFQRAPGQWQLVLVGYPVAHMQEYYENVQKQAALDDRVIIIPGLPPDETEAAIRDADVLLLPSLGESAGPLVVLQAMAHGIPWIASPACNAVADEGGGVIAPVAQFPRITEILLRRNNLSIDLGINGIKHWRSCFTWEKTIDEFKCLFDNKKPEAGLEMPGDIRKELHALRHTVDTLLPYAGRNANDAAAMLYENKTVFSVIIPTYNRVDTLKKCLQALEEQTFPAKYFEVIVCDDGSTDGTENIVKAFAPSFRMTYLKQPNSGPAKARNLAVKNARGSYVLFLNDDAVMEKNALELHFRSHKAHADKKVAVLGKFSFLPGFTSTLFGYCLENTKLLFAYCAMKSGELYNYKRFYTCNISVSRQAVLDAGLFDEGFTVPASEDIELGYRLEKAGYSVLYNAECVAWHHHDMTPEEFCKVRRVRGEGAVYLIAKHPEASWYSTYDLSQIEHWEKGIADERVQARQLLDFIASHNKKMEQGADYEPELAMIEKALKSLYTYWTIAGFLDSPFLKEAAWARKGTQPATASQDRKYTVQFYVYKNVHWPMFESLYEYLKGQSDVGEIIICLPDLPQLIGAQNYELAEKLLDSGATVVANPRDKKVEVTFIADTIAGKVTGCGKIVNVGHGTISKGYYFTESFWTERENWVDLLCVPGAYAAERFANVLKTRVAATGMPKLDPVFSGAFDRNHLCELLHLNPEKKIVLYAPTFNIDLSSVYDFQNRFSELRGQDRYVLIKLHGSTLPQTVAVYRRMAERFEDIIFIDDPNIAPYIGGADIMISDVSSASMEFMALDRPVLLYNNPRRMHYHGYNEQDIEYAWRDLATEADSFDELKVKLEALLRTGDDSKSSVRRQYAERLFADKTGCACANVWAETKRELQQGSGSSARMPLFSDIVLVTDENYFAVRSLIYALQLYSVLPHELVLVAQSVSGEAKSFANQASFFTQFERVAVVQVQSGLAAEDALFEGVQKASGDIIMVLGEAVQVYKNYDYVVYKAFQSNPEILALTGVTNCDVKDINYAQYIKADKDDSYERLAYEFINRFQGAIPETCPLSMLPPVFSFRRSLIHQARGDRESFFRNHVLPKIRLCKSLMYSMIAPEDMNVVKTFWKNRHQLPLEKRLSGLKEINQCSFWPDMLEQELEDMLTAGKPVKALVGLAVKSMGMRFYDTAYKKRLLERFPGIEDFAAILRKDIALIEKLSGTSQAKVSSLRARKLQSGSLGKRVLFYFFKNVHIPIIIPIYEKFKQLHPEAEIAFGYMQHAPQIRAGFTHEELQILKSYGEKMFASPQEFRPDITFIADSVYPWVQGCGKLVNVGHGVLSKGQYYTDTATARREQQADIVCVPGRYHENIMRKIISRPVVATGMAKLDRAFSGDMTRATVIGQYGLPQDYRYILFAPTFNDELSAIPFVEDRIGSVLADDRTALIIKLHGSTTQEYQKMYRRLVEKDPRIIFADELDITPLLVLADVMISDVSSAMMEFAALDKPLVLFNNPNWASYKNYTPSDIEFCWRDIGMQVSDLRQMQEAVRHCFAHPNELCEKRKLYTDQLFANKYNGRAAECIIENAFSLLAEETQIRGAA